MAPRKQIDWEAVEREYRAGQLSIREIGAQFNLSHVAVLKRAKKEGWVQNLSARIKEAVTTKLVTDEVTEATAREVVEIAAARGVEIITRHRKSVARLHDLADALTEKAKELTEQAKDGVDAKALSAAIASIESLSRTLSRLIPLERQAFNLDESNSDTTTLEALVRKSLEKTA